jgi:RNase H-fold protein (predicted Holliday junction resolvase)
LRILALDYGSARTGVAVSDPTGTVARPLCVVERAATEAGLARLRELVREEGAERFVEGLRAAVDVPIETFDERFTTTLAGPGPGDDARAAAHLLSSYLEWSSRRS